MTLPSLGMSPLDGLRIVFGLIMSVKRRVSDDFLAAGGDGIARTRKAEGGRGSGGGLNLMIDGDGIVTRNDGPFKFASEAPGHD